MTWTTTIGDWIEEAKLSVEGHDVAVYENIVAVAEDGIYHSYLGVLIDEGIGIGGSTVALCDRNTAINGYPDADGDTGIVYVYAWNPAGMGGWEEVQTLEALDKSAGDRFGCAVAAYGDTIAIGALGDNVSMGAAYVFTRPPGADPFADKASLDLSRLAHALLDIFGITADAWNTVIESVAMGAIGLDYTFASVNDGLIVSDGLERIGNAFILHYTSGVTTVTDVETMIDNLVGADQLIQVKTYGTTPGYILTELIDPDDTFAATHLSMMGTFNTIIESIATGTVGNSYTFACTPDGGGADSITRAGTDFTLHFTSGATTVAQVEILIGALAGADKLIQVKTPGTDPGYILVDLDNTFTAIKLSNCFTEIKKLVASDGAMDDLFGSDIALDANTIIVGSPRNDEAESNAGAIYAYAIGAWGEQKLLVADPMEDDRLGLHRTLAICGDTFIAGCPEKGGWAGTPLGMGAGVAYVFVCAGVWSQAQKLVASDGEAGGRFGSAVGIDDHTIFVGASAGKPEE